MNDTVSSVSVRRLIDIGVSAGMQRGIVLAAAGVSDADLDDPEARLPLASRIAVWEAIDRYDSDPAFGVRAGSEARVRTYGLLGYILCFSSTLREALERATQYGGLLTDEVQLRMEERSAETRFTIHRAVAGADQPTFEDYRLAGWLQVCREMTGVDLVPVEVCFIHGPPKETLVHREYFRCPLHFGSKDCCIVLRRSDLALPILKSDEALAGYLTRYANQLLASLVRDDSWRHRVRAAIWSSLADGKPSLTRVSRQLGVPPRTLQRRLSAEGTSLHQEVDDIRKRMSMAILRDRSLSVTDVSLLLGYAEPSVFFRSFRRWTGTTPREFRRQAA